MLISRIFDRRISTNSDVIQQFETLYTADGGNVCQTEQGFRALIAVIDGYPLFDEIVRLEYALDGPIEELATNQDLLRRVGPHRQQSSGSTTATTCFELTALSSRRRSLGTQPRRRCQRKPRGTSVAAEQAAAADEVTRSGLPLLPSQPSIINNRVRSHLGGSGKIKAQPWLTLSP